MKKLAAICPLCLQPVVLGPALECRPMAEDEATVVAHLQTHTLVEWVRVTQQLRDALARLDDYEQLRRYPSGAMPRA